jgi:hypothetical protein
LSEPRAGLTGGCQCGAIRYRLAAAPFDSNLCHCRMCQKAGGGPFMVFASVKRDAFEVTRGEISRYRSSEIAERGFCPQCGTPLTYEGSSAKHVSVTIGSLDDPNAVGIKEQLGVQAEVTWLKSALQAPSSRTDDWLAKKHLASAGSHQHPDHET